MSELTARLMTERPSRKLCNEAINRINALEEALLEIERRCYGLPNKAGDLLKHVQTALYDRETADAMERSRT